MMQLQTGLFQQQTTSLHITPNLIQAISLLQFSTQELTDFIEEKANENPLIELKERKDPLFHTTCTSQAVSLLDAFHRKQPTLHEHLIEQLRFQQMDEVTAKRLKYTVYSLDSNGYLKGSFQQLCSELAVSLEEGEKLLGKLQSLEPAGIGARNLRECLLLQLKNKPERNEIAESIIQDYIEVFANKQWRTICKALDVSLEDVQRANDLIQTLNPRPGAVYSSETPQYIRADVSLLEIEGELIITLNDKLIPKIRLHAEYKSLLKEKYVRTDEFINQKYIEWKWLVKSIEQRQATLYKVVKAITEVQQSYFQPGGGKLKPMTLRKIAEETGFHESTISRVTANKFIDTPKGIFELKHFFANSINGTEDAPTSTYVKQLIKEIIGQENKLKPFSDQKIVQLLKQEKQIDLSRRAVAKYRHELNILSSSKRKRFIAN